MISVQLLNGQMLLPVKVTPKGGKDCILPFVPGDTFIRLKASCPPEDGKANAAVIALLAEVLQLPKSRLKIVQGEKARQKRIGISNLTAEEPEVLLRHLAQALQASREDIFHLARQG